MQRKIQPPSTIIDRRESRLRHELDIILKSIKNCHWKQPEHEHRQGSINTTYTVKTGVSFRHSLRHRKSASASVVSTLKSVCLRVKTTLLSVKTTLRLSYRVLEMTL
jgi:hypothetical protein